MYSAIEQMSSPFFSVGVVILHRIGGYGVVSSRRLGERAGVSRRHLQP
jgi:hypothetical protein